MNGGWVGVHVHRSEEPHTIATGQDQPKQRDASLGELASLKGNMPVICSTSLPAALAFLSIDNASYPASLNFPSFSKRTAFSTFLRLSLRTDDGIDQALVSNGVRQARVCFLLSFSVHHFDCEPDVCLVEDVT